jgi:hypothetical protein
MVISDLSHCIEAEANRAIGGRRFGFPVLIVQTNRAIVYQGAKASATAFSYGGHASALAVAINTSDIDQDIDS